VNTGDISVVQYASIGSQTSSMDGAVTI